MKRLLRYTGALYVRPFVEFYHMSAWEKALVLAFMVLVGGAVATLVYYEVKCPTDYVTEYLFPRWRR